MFIVLGMGVQGIVMLVQVAFSRLGTDLASPTSDSIAESSVTVSMWLYVGLVAPICEEVLFRGVLMKEPAVGQELRHRHLGNGVRPVP